jgi:iron complex outermembrane receptor protein
VSTGYQAGFFNTTFDAVTGESLPNEVDPEEILAFEIGAKSSLPDERGFLNAAAFYYDYKDMQVLVGSLFLLPDGSPDPSQPPFFYATNAAKAEIYGLDIDLTELRLATHLMVEASATYLNATYKDYKSIQVNDRSVVNYKGNTLPRAPEFTVASALVFDNFRFGDYADASVRLEYNYRDTTYFTPANTEFASQDAYGLLNLFATVNFDEGRWSLTAAGRNLTDEEYFDFKDNSNFANTGEFRSWEVRARFNFR